MSHPQLVKVWRHDEVVVEMHPEEAAEMVAGLRYDALQSFLKYLSAHLWKNAIKDEEKGRRELAQELLLVSANISSASHSMQRMWKICESYEKVSTDGRND